MNKVKIITALFDIGREAYGDGRSMQTYLNWFSKTLELKADMVIYTEEKFYDFVVSRRSLGRTEIKVQKISEIPYFKYRERISRILKDPSYLSKIKDSSRIECKLDLYNVIQYSKFGWLKDEVDNGNEENFYFWMDAGCSRFFSDFDLENEWPNSHVFSSKKFIIQGNINTQRILPGLVPEEYKWNNECILVGTLFGGNGKILKKISSEIRKIFEEEMLNHNMVNNEQIALAILFKRSPELFDVIIKLDNTHLPIFKILGNNSQI